MIKEKKQKRIEGIKTDVSTEIERKYHFPGNWYVIIKDPIELIVRDSGTHRIISKDGHLHIIPMGWIHIEIISSSSWVV